MKDKGFVPVAQIKRINKPFPDIHGGSFGDALYIHRKLLKISEVIYFSSKHYLVNLIIFEVHSVNCSYREDTFMNLKKNGQNGLEQNTVYL